MSFPDEFSGSKTLAVFTCAAQLFEGAREISDRNRIPLASTIQAFKR
jgi:hypothetical protein